MNRREALKFLGTVLSLSVLADLSADEILAFAQEVHARLPEQSAGSYVFKTLDPNQNKAVTIITDLIIPETDTPGAVAARVNEFIDLMLTEMFKGEDRERFLAGLAELDRQSQIFFGKGFIECDKQQQIDLLKSQEEEAIAAEEGQTEEMSWGRPRAPREHFFHAIKWLTLLGYYTSEVGMLDELGWQMIPGSYTGCDHW
jgi:hypothetical protein